MGKKGSASGQSAARSRIVDAALLLFGERGFAGTTTREIAARAEVNEVTLFRHFDTKLDLYKAVLVERSPIIGDITHSVKAEPTTTLDELILANMHLVLRALRANRSLVSMMYTDVWRFPELAPLVSEALLSRGFDLLESTLRMLGESGRLKQMDYLVAARALMGMVQWYFVTNDLLRVTETSEADEQRTLEGFVAVFLDGVRASGTKGDTFSGTGL